MTKTRDWSRVLPIPPLAPNQDQRLNRLGLPSSYSLLDYPDRKDLTVNKLREIFAEVSAEFGEKMARKLFSQASRGTQGQPKKTSLSADKILLLAHYDFLASIHPEDGLQARCVKSWGSGGLPEHLVGLAGSEVAWTQVVQREAVRMKLKRALEKRENLRRSSLRVRAIARLAGRSIPSLLGPNRTSKA